MLVYTIPPIQFAESYVWTLPDGSTVTTATNSISLDFLTPASGGILTVHGENANCGAGGESPSLTDCCKSNSGCNSNSRIANSMLG